MPDTSSASSHSDRVLAIARERGMARARDFRSAGIPPSCVSRLCEKGELVRLARGLYQLAEPEVIEAGHSLAEASRLAPNGVISLLSALAYHEFTTQLPGAVWMTIPHKARTPSRMPFRLEVVRATGEALTAGQTTVVIEGVEVRITDPAKTIVDCFKYRSRVGLDVALEALRDGLRSRKAHPDEIWRYAKVCRQLNVMRPYMEAMAFDILHDR